MASTQFHEPVIGSTPLGDHLLDDATTHNHRQTPLYTAAVSSSSSFFSWLTTHCGLFAFFVVLISVLVVGSTHIKVFVNKSGALSDTVLRTSLLVVPLSIVSAYFTYRETY